MDLPLPKVRFIFATNILAPLPEAFKNRCKFIELSDYTEAELAEIVHKRFDGIPEDAISNIIKAGKGVPRTTLSLAQSIISGLKTEKILDISPEAVNSILDSRFKINSNTGLNQKEFTIIQKVLERGHLSTTAVANLLHTTSKDAKLLYIEPLRAAEWLAVSSHGVIPGYRAHEHYREFIKRKEEY